MCPRYEDDPLNSAEQAEDNIGYELSEVYDLELGDDDWDDSDIDEDDEFDDFDDGYDDWDWDYADPFFDAEF